MSDVIVSRFTPDHTKVVDRYRSKTLEVVTDELGDVWYSFPTWGGFKRLEMPWDAEDYRY
jgi:hypothetical protein